ncbi:ABC transporter ATP-binding protein, partial [Mesorhizobium sp. M7A.F.Ca.US.001.01.1.1]
LIGNQTFMSLPVMTGKDIKVWFPIKQGFFRRTVDNVKAVDGIDVTVRAGQTLGVVGESGSGKTTLGLALARMISSTGMIQFNGRDINQLSFNAMRPLRRELQIVFQDPFGSLSPRMSIAEIIEEGLKIHEPKLSPDERDDKVAAVLKEVGLDPATRNRYPHEFSGGQRQRIAIARAMILKPRLVVLDEPTSALDRSVQKQIVELLRKLQADHELSYLFISHDLSVVRAMADYIIVMKQGKIVEEGPTEAIFSNPQHAYTQTLMAAAIDVTRFRLSA